MSGRKPHVLRLRPSIGATEGSNDWLPGSPDCHRISNTTDAIVEGMRQFSTPRSSLFNPVAMVTESYPPRLIDYGDRTGAAEAAAELANDVFILRRIRYRSYKESELTASGERVATN